MVSVFSYDNAGNYLKDVLSEKRQKNPAFSLRSFAKLLGLSAAHLSRVIKGGHRISPVKAMDIARGLRMAPAETEYFNLIVQLELAKTERTREEIKSQLSLRSAKPVEDLLQTQISVVMSPESLERAKEKIFEFIEKFRLEVQEPAGTEVCHLNLQFFRSSKGSEL